VADYGHGFITEKIAKVISDQKIFLSLNAQINSSNGGFHSIKKYPNCNSIIINESELRHELRSRGGNLNELMKVLSVNLKADFVVVTRGTEGSTIYNKKKDLYTDCPAFAAKVVDKVGSGDALLPIISISLAKKIDDDISLLLGSLAAAQSVETISNSKSVNKIEIIKTLQHAIK
jgi:sugar/nucleoside kinase (ribokinase family)